MAPVIGAIFMFVNLPSKKGGHALIVQEQHSTYRR